MRYTLFTSIHFDEQIQTFKKGELDYMELVDGTFLNNVMNQMWV